MKLIKRAEPRCLCMDKLYDFNEQQGGLEVGSIVECDCGKRYVRSDSQRDGKFWQLVSGQGSLG